MKKRLFAILLAVMVFAVAGPLEVFAAGNTTPAPVTYFRTFSSAGAVGMTWNAVPGVTGYIITWSGAGNVNHQHWIADPAQTTEMFPVVQDETYYFTIQSYIKNADGSISISPQYETQTGEAIRTLHYSITFKKSRTLTSHSGGKKKIAIPKGSVITARGYTDGKYIFDYVCDDGMERMFYVTRISVRNQQPVYLNTAREYDRTEAESFVNRLGLSSRTNKLIWVNTSTQKIYIFNGSQGNWQLEQGGWEVATGSVRTPTSTGLTRIKQKVRSNGAPFWNVCSYFSIHGNARVWGALGTPKSNGCVRNTYDHAKWIYYNCKKGTAVYVY